MTNPMEHLAALDAWLAEAPGLTDEQWEHLLAEIARGPLPPHIVGARDVPLPALMAMMRHVSEQLHEQAVMLNRRRHMGKIAQPPLPPGKTIVIQEFRRKAVEPPTTDMPE